MNPFVAGGVEWYVRSIDNGTLNVDLVTEEIGDKVFSVFDLNGRLIFWKSIELIEGRNEFSFALGELNTGVYICSIDGKSQKKIFIQ